MNDLYSILSVSADDIVIDVRYGIIYGLREGMLDLSDAWVHRPILERCRGYTHQNAIRLNRIAVAHDARLVVALPLVDPDVAIQEMVDDISDLLRELLPWPSALDVEHPWREVRMFTRGAPESAEKDLTASIEAVRRSKPDNGG